MLIKKNGEKIFIGTRRLFERDLRRHFVGEVQECTDFAVRVQGYAFVFDDINGDLLRREVFGRGLFPYRCRVGHPYPSYGNKYGEVKLPDW